MENQPEDNYVIEGSWGFIIMPEEFCIYGLQGVIDLFTDLYEIGAEYHKQYPTAVFYEESDDGMST